MELEEFQSNCNAKKCLKRTRWDSKTCVRSSKQINCHKSYERAQNKKVQKREEDQEDWQKEEDFRNSVWARDSGQSKDFWKSELDKKPSNWKLVCCIWNILDNSERNYLESDPELWLNVNLEVAHIRPKSVYLDQKYVVENCVLIGHTFHRRLTDLKHPVYSTPISNEDAVLWLESARDKKRLIR